MPTYQAGTFPRDELYQSLLLGMHAMAQPLTVLQSRLYLALARLEADGGEDLLLAGAAEELASLCTLFQLLQQLFHLNSVPPKLAATPIREVIEALKEDAEAVFAGSARSLVFSEKLDAAEIPVAAERAADRGRDRILPGPETAVRVDMARTRLALSQTLAVARECGRAESRLTCDLHLSGQWVEFEVEAREGALAAAGENRKANPEEAAVPDTTAAGGNVEVSPLTEMAGLLLASAQVALTSQQAELGFRASPLRLLVRLPVVPPNA